MASSTSPDGIVFPDASDPIAPLNAVFQDLAESVQTALDGVPSLNVDVTSPSYGQVISYDPASDNFINNPDNNPVMVFDDATDRATAIPTPVEGMVTYLKDTDQVSAFTGSAFTAVGGLIAVKSAIFAGIQVQSSVAGGANFAVTDLSITHEVADPANRLIISAFFGAASKNSGFPAVGIAVHDGTGLINVGASPGFRTAVSAGGFPHNTSSTFTVTMPSVTFVHTPGAGSKTYTVRAVNIDADSRTVFINRADSDTDSAARSRAVSSLVIQEVAV